MQPVEKNRHRTAIWQPIAFFGGIIFICLVVCLYSTDVVVSFLISLFFAIILNKPVTLLHTKFKLPRSITSIIAVIGLCITLVSIVYIALPVMITKLSKLLNDIYYTNHNMQQLFYDLTHYNATILGYQVPDSIEKFILSLIQNSMQIVKQFASQSMHISFKIITFIGIALLTPIMTLFLLKDLPLIVGAFFMLFPKRYRKDIKTLTTAIGQSLINYVYGQLIVAIFLTFFYGCGLKILNLNNAFTVGAIIGFGSFIPYIGFYCGAIIALIIGYEQYHTISQTCVILGVLILGQIIEGNFITPKVIGDKLGVHPLWIIISVLICIPLFGMMGAILALPIVGIINQISKFIFEKYQKSTFYNE